MFPKQPSRLRIWWESELQTISFGGECESQRTHSDVNVYILSSSKHSDVSLNPPSSPCFFSTIQRATAAVGISASATDYILHPLSVPADNKALMAASPSQAPNGPHITTSEHLKDCLGASPQHLTREGWRLKNNCCVTSMWFIAIGNYVYRAPSGDPICALYEQKLKSTHTFLWTWLWTAHT